MTSQQQKKYEEALKKATTKIKELSQKLSEVQQYDPVAVIGMGCRFPGGANTPEEFWKILEQGIDTVTEIPKDRWNVEEYYDADMKAPGKMYTKYGCFLDQPIDTFDNEFFDISPEEAEALDPQQRLLLEVSWEALEHAGLNVQQLQGSRTGVFIGISTYDYAVHSSVAIEKISPYSAGGTILSATSGRLAFFYDFQGPTMAIDTACSSSLVALHSAIHSLARRESDIALAGGVNLLLIPQVFIGLSKSQSLAPDGRCKSFDASADGFGRGEGCGILVLKRLSDAQRDRDQILTLIKGSAVYHNGKSNGLTSPNPLAQEYVIREALQGAQVEPGDIDYIETHGTGTQLGDPIEIRALGEVFQNRKTPLLLSCVKTNIGHLEAAAGMAGIIKAILAIQHQQIPPTLHLTQPNPYIPWDTLPFKVVTEPIPWKDTEHTRFAGVSSFGISGTNAHIILQEPPAGDTQAEIPESQHARPYHVLTLSAKQETALSELVKRYIAYFSHKHDTVADICYTTNVSRSSFEYRFACVGQSHEDFLQHLSSLTRSSDVTILASPPFPVSSSHKIAFLFAGQDTLYPSIAQELYHASPTFQEALKACDALFYSYSGYSLLDVLYSKQAEEAVLQKSLYAQPITFAIEYALTQVWKSWGIHPKMVLGVGIGEYTAACVAGLFPLEEAIKAVAIQSRLSEDRSVARKLETITFANLKIPMISTRTGKLVVNKDIENPEYWSTPVSSPECFDDALKTAEQEGCRIFVGIGGTAALTECVSQSISTRNVIALPSLRKGNHPWQQVLIGLSQLYMAGADIDWGKFHEPSLRKKVVLPTYPFQRKRYWIESDREPETSAQRPDTEFESEAQMSNIPEGFYLVEEGDVERGDNILDMGGFPNVCWYVAEDEEIGIPVETFDGVARKQKKE